MLNVFLLAAVLATDLPSRPFPASGFHGVTLATTATVRIAYAPRESLTVTGDPRILACVTATVENGSLVIGWRRPVTTGRTAAEGEVLVVGKRPPCRHPSDRKSLLAIVETPLLDTITLRDKGIIRTASFASPSLRVAVPGSGAVEIERLDAKTVDLSIPGHGSVRASGHLGQVRESIAGTGVIDTALATASALDVHVGGHGQVVADVAGPVTGTLAGRGSIRVGGHPLCAISKEGFGHIACGADASR